MRFYFPNLTRPKRAAKAMVANMNGVSLAQVQRALAITYGYKDWHELEASHAAAAPTPLDQHLPDRKVPARIVELATRFADALDLYRADAAWLIAKSHATGDLELDQWLTSSISDGLHNYRILGRGERGKFRMLSAQELADAYRPGLPDERKDEPDRLNNRIPLPASANDFVEELVGEYEQEEGIHVRHVYYHEHENWIRITLQFNVIMRSGTGFYAETEHDSSFQYKKKDLSWIDDTRISPRSALASYRMPAVLQVLENIA